MATMPASLAYVSTWSSSPGGSSTTSDVKVTLSRASGEATVADRGRVGNQECVSGSFLRIPYDVEVSVGDDDAVGIGILQLQATSDAPSDMLFVTDDIPLTVTLSAEWEDAAEGELGSNYTEWGWVMYFTDEPSAPRLSIDVEYETPDANGVGVLWRGDLTPD